MTFVAGDESSILSDSTPSAGQCTVFVMSLIFTLSALSRICDASFSSSFFVIYLLISGKSMNGFNLYHDPD